MILLLPLLLLESCNKHKLPPHSDSRRRLKTVNYRLSAESRESISFFYEAGRLAHTLRIDSGYSKWDWQVHTTVDDYSYDAANRLVQLSNPYFTDRFIYGGGGRLLQRIRTGPYMQDTIRFSYSSGKVVGAWRMKTGETMYYYFSKELDRIEIWDAAGSSPTWSKAYKYRPGTDLSGIRFLESIDLLIKADFGTGTIPYWYNVFEPMNSSEIALPTAPGQPPTTFSTQHFSREYDPENFPLTQLRDGKQLMYYSYY